MVENEGNTPVHAAVSVADPDRLLEFQIKPDTLVTNPGTATFVRLQAVPKERFLRGPNRTLPFQVLLQAAEFAPATGTSSASPGALNAGTSSPSPTP